MKITKGHDDQIMLHWSYNIKSNKVLKNDKVYYFYTVIFPMPVYHFFNQENLYLYEFQGKYYLCKDEPQLEHMKVKLISKNSNNYSKEITLSKKFFKFLDGYVEGSVEYIFYADGLDWNGEQGVLELKINLGGKK